MNQATTGTPAVIINRTEPRAGGFCVEVVKERIPGIVVENKSMAVARFQSVIGGLEKFVQNINRNPLSLCLCATAPESSQGS